MTAKELIKIRNLRFLHPDVVSKSDDVNTAAILKAVGYFRNFAIFKTMYTLLYKSRNLSLEQYRGIYNMLVDYKTHHPKDYFIDGFSAAMAKSTVVAPEVKSLYAIMVYDQLYKNDELFAKAVNRTGRKLERAIADYYKLDKAVNVAIIRDYKVLKIGNGNLVKSIVRWTRS